jgi:hypothetical protein
MPSASSDIEHAIADTLWMQWRALGVQAASAPARSLVDPEALLIESAIVATHIEDPRIADAAIAWSIRHHELVVTARLKSLLKTYDESDRAAFLTMSRRVIDIAGRLSWPAAPSARAWKPSVDVRLPQLAGRPELLRLRSRALFGANARAEALSYLVCAGDQGVDLASLERATSFSKRHLAGPLELLVLEGSVERWWLGNRQLFRLRGAALELLGGSPPGALQWIDWSSRLRVARMIGAAAVLLQRPGGVVTAVGRIRAAADQLQRHGLDVPRPLEIDQEPDERIPELARWIDQATTQLLTA